MFKIQKAKYFLIFSFIVLLSCCSKTHGNSYNVNPAKPPFVNIKKIIPDIELDIRYATRNNFVGEILDGYKKPYCWLLPKTAYKLKKIQKELRLKGLGLKIYDGYRPIRAIKHMIRWAKTKTNILGIYVSSRIDKTKKIGHPSGNTVDLTIINYRTKNEINMGTDFDYFGKKSWTFNAIGQIRKNRMILYKIMIKHGFRNFFSEWWHYENVSEPGNSHDMIIE